MKVNIDLTVLYEDNTVPLERVALEDILLRMVPELKS
jgi:hypothetical protein